MGSPWLPRLFDPLDDGKGSSEVARILKDASVNGIPGCGKSSTESLWKADCLTDTSSEPGNKKPSNPWCSNDWEVYKPESGGLDLPVTSEFADDIYGV